MAARGTRNPDTGEEKIMDGTLIEKLRIKARSINRRALLTGAVITLAALAFPY